MASCQLNHTPESLAQEGATLRSAQILVGMLPFVGDAIDGFELTTGLDFWTREQLTSEQYLITAGAAALPLVSGSSIRRLMRSAPAALNPLSREARDALRASLGDIWQARAGRRAIWDGMDVHHRIPLEWSHLFPNSNPNRISNLIGMTPGNHTQVTNAWNAWRQGLNGRIPTQAEVVQQAIRIDEQFGNLMRFLP